MGDLGGNAAHPPSILPPRHGVPDRDSRSARETRDVPLRRSGCRSPPLSGLSLLCALLLASRVVGLFLRGLLGLFLLHHDVPDGFVGIEAFRRIGARAL